MAKKTITPSGSPKNIPDRSTEGKVKGQVPKMRNPPPPPKEKK